MPLNFVGTPTAFLIIHENLLLNQLLYNISKLLTIHRESFYFPFSNTNYFTCFTFDFSYGRKITLITAELCTVIFAALSAAGQQLWMFIICRCLIGVGVGGTMLCSYIYIIEFSGKSFRSQATGLHDMSYVSGYFSMAVIAYFVRDWRFLQLVTSVPWVFITVYFWVLPESPRWLITVGRKKEAIDLLTRIAKR